jgi:hypothetical protein
MRLQLPRTTLPAKQLARRLDRVAGELNVILVVIALGLGVLDLTCLWALKIEDALPPITRVSAPPSAASPATESRP